MTPRPFIMVAPNGATRGKADHPALPVTIADTVATASACYQAGADALHLHVRDSTGHHSLDSGLYREACAELHRVLPEISIQVTTEAAGVFSVSDQLACLAGLRPAWATIAVREIARDPDLAGRVYSTCAEIGTCVQHILYDTGDIRLLANWRTKGIVRADQSSVLFVLGRYDRTRASTPNDIVPFLKQRSGYGNWMVCAFGASEHACLIGAAQLGGAVRVGFENSLGSPDGTIWPDNAASVRALSNAFGELADAS
ncbi:MAG: 3-keto-5-aminohexanoate cleavage protein [Pseudomonadota bacterium]